MSRPDMNQDRTDRTDRSARGRRQWFVGRWSRRGSPTGVPSSSPSMEEKDRPMVEKWTMGILNDRETEDVPGTVLMLSSNRNEPLGLRHESASGHSLPSSIEPRRISRHTLARDKKRTPDGEVILEPQPDDSLNDPLNWPAWRRDMALLSLGFYCMLGGGMTPILAAGFNNVASSYGVSYAQVALTTGLYMMGMGVGSVVASPTAILFGKRPVYLVSAIMFVCTSIWCAVSPNYASLAAARVFQGISVSPVECLPSATIAEIFFLHERAFRIGIYTLLLLGGKNLIPLVSAAIIQSKGWRWVFFIVAMVAGFGFASLFLFVPETFWDRTPRPRARGPTMHRSFSNLVHNPLNRTRSNASDTMAAEEVLPEMEKVMTPRQQKLHDMDVHARFLEANAANVDVIEPPVEPKGLDERGHDGTRERNSLRLSHLPLHLHPSAPHTAAATTSTEVDSGVPHLHNLNSPFYLDLERKDDYLTHHTSSPSRAPADPGHTTAVEKRSAIASQPAVHEDKAVPERPKLMRYTTELRNAPPKSYVASLRPWNGRLTRTNWFLVALRPFILYAYPSVLWSALVYSLSIGWLIVLSESVSNVYRRRDTYNFSALGVGLVYLSPFVGGVLGTAVAGRVSDILVKAMSRRNGGVYEPEFRLVMAAPVMVTTVIGLMGFGWSAQERDAWIVPTIFFGVISFGCSLGSTTAITFCVDSYRQYAGEALVTLNFSKNIFHGLLFSLFFARWLEDDGPKKVFLAIGGIQIACLLTTIPMYIYGKRARMMTVRKKWMERF